MSKNKWTYYPPTENDISEGLEEYNIVEKNDMPYDIPHYVGTVCSEKDARLVATAPEMYELLCEFLKIDKQKAYAATEKNDPAYMMALVAQDRAVNMAEELLARIDGKENSND